MQYSILFVNFALMKKKFKLKKGDKVRVTDSGGQYDVQVGQEITVIRCNDNTSCYCEISDGEKGYFFTGEDGLHDKEVELSSESKLKDPVMIPLEEFRKDDDKMRQFVEALNKKKD